MSNNPNDAAYFEFIQEFRQETDRAAVVLGAAKLDLLLYQLLEVVLLPSTGSRDELLDSDGPLGTFSAKINLVHRLRLIDAAFARALHLVRRVRNSFAHETASNSLNSGAHRDRVRELVTPFRSKSEYHAFHATFFGEERSAASDFRTVLAIMAARLEGAIEDDTSLGARTTCSLIPPLFELVDAAQQDPNQLPLLPTTDATKLTPGVS